MARLRLNTRVTFFSPISGERTETGGSKSGTKEEFKAWAGVIYLRGGETVMSSRMQGKKPAVLVLRKLEKLDLIAGDWIAKFGSATYQVRELPKVRDDGCTCEMLVEFVS